MRWLLGLAVLWAQGPDSLYLTIEAAEARFLKENLLLYAQKLRISAQEALVLQASLWPNPQFSADQMDFFAPPNRDFRPLLDNPRWYQVAVTLSQTLLTAGKRSHNIALQQATVRIQEAAWAELLRQLRYQLRLTLRAAQRDQIFLTLLSRQDTLLGELIRRYEALSKAQVVPTAEYLRLRSLQKALQTTLRERYQVYEENQNQLRQLLNLPIQNQILWIDTISFWPSMTPLALPPLDSLLSTAVDRPDVRLAALQIAYDEANLRLEKAYAYPDVDISVGYDRLSSYRPNIVGVGVGLPLPLWNRNQGRIRAAEISRQTSQVLYENALSTAQSEILTAWRTFQLISAQWQTADLDLLETYEDVEARYVANLQAQRVNFLAYVDFFQSYRDLVDNMTQLAYAYHEALEKLRLSTTRMP